MGRLDGGVCPLGGDGGEMVGEGGGGGGRGRVLKGVGRLVVGGGGGCGGGGCGGGCCGRGGGGRARGRVFILINKINKKLAIASASGGRSALQW